MFVCLGTVLDQGFSRQKTLILSMTDLAGTGPVGSFLDVVGCCIPVVGERVVPLHFYPGAFKGVPDCRDKPQRCYGFFVSGAQTETEIRFGSSPFSQVTTGAISVSPSGVAGVTAYLSFVLCVGCLGLFRLFFSCFMAVNASRFFLHLFFCFVSH